LACAAGIAAVNVTLDANGTCTDARFNKVAYGTGIDWLQGDSGVDSMYGGDGNDSFSGGTTGGSQQRRRLHRGGRQAGQHEAATQLAVFDALNTAVIGDCDSAT